MSHGSQSLQCSVELCVNLLLRVCQTPPSLLNSLLQRPHLIENKIEGYVFVIGR